jgi:hypothetical protein
MELITLYLTVMYSQIKKGMHLNLMVGLIRLIKFYIEEFHYLLI